MNLAFVTTANANATSVRISGATPYASVPRYVDIDSEQAWFWTPAWQAAERQADDDFANGRYEDFDTMDDFLASLES